MTSRRQLAGIVSVLDAEHSAAVARLWDVLREGFGLEAVSISPVPHLCYQVTRGHDPDALAAIVEHLASEARALRVRTTGVGIFTGDVPIVYVPVVRSPELTRFHLALWSATALVSGERSGDYHPAYWMPHITLAQGDVSAKGIGSVVERLNSETLNWELELDNLCVLEGRGNHPQEITLRTELKGAARNF